MLSLNPIISILIATKNRIPYCINTIETILQLPNKNFNLIVQDNSDSKELFDYVSNFISDSRLIYNYTPPPFSSIDNFNAALELASGEYVCLIGDDDGICSQIFEVVEWASKNKIESICPKIFCEYIWPDSLGTNDDAKLAIPDTEGTIKSVDTSKLLTRFFEQGALDYLSMGFPKLYHGIVKMECLERIKDKTGNYLGGLSPDIYAAITLACTVKSHVVIDFPLTIAGSCKQSTTIASVKGKHSGNLKNAPHFRDRGIYIWDSLIPPIYSIETIWAETALKALEDMKRTDLRILFNVDVFTIKNILRNTNKSTYFVFETIKHLKKNKTNVLRYLKLVFLFFNFIFEFIIKRFFKTRILKVSNSTFNKVPDIKSATDICTKTLINRKIYYPISKNN